MRLHAHTAWPWTMRMYSKASFRLALLQASDDSLFTCALLPKDQLAVSYACPAVPYTTDKCVVLQICG